MWTEKIHPEFVKLSDVPELFRLTSLTYIVAGFGNIVSGVASRLCGSYISDTLGRSIRDTGENSQAVE